MNMGSQSRKRFDSRSDFKLKFQRLMTQRLLVEAVAPVSMLRFSEGDLATTLEPFS